MEYLCVETELTSLHKEMSTLSNLFNLMKDSHTLFTSLKITEGSEKLQTNTCQEIQEPANPIDMSELEKELLEEDLKKKLLDEMEQQAGCYMM